MSRLEKLIAQYCPNGVEFQKIGDICNVFAGGTPKTSNSDFYDMFNPLHEFNSLYDSDDEW